MTALGELESQIREVLEEEMTGDSDQIERTLHRILQIVNPFEKAAREELERYRLTFAELAK
jgi:hypothetical protein